MFTEEQFNALDKAASLMGGMRFQPPPTEDMIENGKVHKFGIKHFQNGFLITIAAVKQMHLDLKNNFGIPTVLCKPTNLGPLRKKYSLYFLCF